ncbi:hypothetical protein ACFXTI_041527 [Malus domestica]
MCAWANDSVSDRDDRSESERNGWWTWWSHRSSENGSNTPDRRPNGFGISDIVRESSDQSGNLEFDFSDKERFRIWANFISR